MELAKFVYAYAEHRYHEDGWDIIVECWELQEIADALVADEVELTVEAAIDSFRERVRLLEDHRLDIQGTAY